MSLRSMAGKAARTTSGALSLTASLLERVASGLDERERSQPQQAAPSPQASSAPSQPARPVPVEHRDEVQVVQQPARTNAKTTADDVPAASARGARISNPKRARAVRKRTAGNTK